VRKSKFTCIFIDAINIKKTRTLLSSEPSTPFSYASVSIISTTEVILRIGANLGVCQFGKGRTGPSMHVRFLFILGHAKVLQKLFHNTSMLNSTWAKSCPTQRWAPSAFQNKAAAQCIERSRSKEVTRRRLAHGGPSAKNPIQLTDRCVCRRSRFCIASIQYARPRSFLRACAHFQSSARCRVFAVQII
jgi:hypothetical protein